MFSSSDECHTGKSHKFCAFILLSRWINSFTGEPRQCLDTYNIDICEMNGWPRGCKTFYKLNSAEHEFYPAHKCKLSVLYPTKRNATRRTKATFRRITSDGLASFISVQRMSVTVALRIFRNQGSEMCSRNTILGINLTKREKISAFNGPD